MATAVAFLGAFALFLAGACPTVSFEDTGELVWNAAVLGVTHPPGYPWLTLLGRLALALPAGEPAFRMNVLAAVAGATAVATVFAIARRLSPADGPGRAAPWIAAAALAGTRTLWWQAGLAEKYALSLALMLLAARALLGAWLARDARRLAAPAFLAGLALSHHLHGLYLLPALGLAIWRLRPAPSRAVLLAFWFALPGMGKALAIPIRSHADPAINWGLPDRADRLLFYLSARQYRFIMGSNRGAADVAGRLVRQVAVNPVREFGPVVALAVPGAAALAAFPGIAAGTGVLLATNAGFALWYNTPEIERYYLLADGLLAVLIGLGAARLARAAPRWGWTAALLLVVPFAVNGRVAPRARHLLAWDFAVNQLAPLPPNALLITEGDDQAFPLFYLHEVRGVRPDVVLLPMPFACWGPSYARLQSRFPGLVFPPFDPDPGRQLPQLVLANARAHPAFYTPGCTGRGSERFLLPRGLDYAVATDPKAADVANRALPRFPALRLRGAADAGRWDDAVTSRAVHNYGTALAYHGADAIQHRDLAEASRYLGLARTMPLEPPADAAVRTHLGLVAAMRGRYAEAATLFADAVAKGPDFGPALFEYGKILLVQRAPVDEARGYFLRASLHRDYLTPGERQELASFLARLR